MQPENEAPQTLEDLFFPSEEEQIDGGVSTPTESETAAESSPAESSFDADPTPDEPATETVDEDSETIPTDNEHTESENESGLKEALAQALEMLTSRLNAIDANQAALAKCFDSKLRYDASKQTIIDRQHEELERFRHEESAKLSKAIVLDIINEIDSAEKNADFYAALDPNAENFAKLLKLLLRSADDMCDLLERHDIFTYRTEAGAPFNAKRQRVLKTVTTDKPELDKTIHSSMRRGFEGTERIIRHELVCVNVYKAPAATPKSGENAD